MTIDSVLSTPPTTPQTTAAAASGALAGTQDEFLKLFMAQLQNQDPFQPQDNAAMVAQLAQFSSVEQQTETNQHLTDMATSQNSSTSAALSSLVGRDCNAAAADFQLDRGGQVPPLQIASTSAMNGASVVITDSTGKEVRRIPIAAGASSATITWDGANAAGAPVAPGSYHVAIDAGTTTGTITSQWHGRVDAVELGGGSTELRMGGVLLAPGTIQTIGLTQPATTSSGA
jgi:flagellar basal-body rod modification protein FlgD